MKTAVIHQNSLIRRTWSFLVMDFHKEAISRNRRSGALLRHPLCIMQSKIVLGAGSRCCINDKLKEIDSTTVIQTQKSVEWDG